MKLESILTAVFVFKLLIPVLKITLLEITDYKKKCHNCCPCATTHILYV